MPRPVVQWVGALLGLIAVTSFTMGIINAPEHGGRLPGERVPGKAAAAGPATAIDAPEATPLSQERIEGPPPPVEKPETKAEVTDEDTSNAAANTTAAPVLNLPPAATNVTPPDQANAPPPPEDEPPH